MIVPLVNSREEAEYAVRAMKYPPWGERGAGVGRAQSYGMNMGEYMNTANDEVVTILMVEHIKAVDNIEEILAVKGVDSVMVGSLDLSGSMGMLGQTDRPEVEAAIQRVLTACKQAKVSAGIITVDPAASNRRIREGFQNLIIGIDVLMMLNAAKTVLGKIERAGA